VGLDGLHVVAVATDQTSGGLSVAVESAPGPQGCPSCGVVAHSHGRRDIGLVDVPCFERPVRLRWRKRTWRCVEPVCVVKVFTEQDHQVAPPRALLTSRACWWAIGQIRHEHASVAGIARQLGTTWNTVWAAVRPLLEAMADDESRFTGVARLGVDEHVWHHVSERPTGQGGRGSKYLTGMVDLTPDPEGRPRARLLDLVAGRSGKAYRDWLDPRTGICRDGVKEATLERTGFEPVASRVPCKLRPSCH
jgi:transposase